MKKYILGIMLSSVLASSACAQDKKNVFEPADMQEKIEKLEKRVSQLSAHADNQPVNDASADAANVTRLNASTVAQLEEVKEQLKKMRGDIEQVQFENARLNEKLVKFAADTELRFNDLNNKKNNVKEDTAAALNNLEQNLDDDFILRGGDAKAKATEKTNEPADSKQGTSSNDKKAASAPNEADLSKVTGDPKLDKRTKEKAIQAQYQDAYSLLKNRDYKAAREAFQKFVTDNPDNELTGNGYYWLGETYFLRAEYDKAAVNYLKGYQSNIRGSRAADNLLKLSKSMAKLEKRKEACTTLMKLQKEFPNAHNSIKKQMDDDKKSLRCNS